jgi:hypothetical protein
MNSTAENNSLVIDEKIPLTFSIDLIENLEIFKQNRKLFLRLKICIEQNNYYEAHQAYKTLHFR